MRSFSGGGRVITVELLLYVDPFASFAQGRNDVLSNRRTGAGADSSTYEVLQGKNAHASRDTKWRRGTAKSRNDDGARRAPPQNGGEGGILT